MSPWRGASGARALTRPSSQSPHRESPIIPVELIQYPNYRATKSLGGLGTESFRPDTVTRHAAVWPPANSQQSSHYCAGQVMRGPDAQSAISGRATHTRAVIAGWWQVSFRPLRADCQGSLQLGQQFTGAGSAFCSLSAVIEF